MARKVPFNVTLHNLLIARDKSIEPNLTEGPRDRIVTWAMLARTVPSSCDEYEILRGFPNA